MGNVDQEREELKKAYPNNPGWAARVDQMKPAQVTAIYIRFRSQGKLGK